MLAAVVAALLTGVLIITTTTERGFTGKAIEPSTAAQTVKPGVVARVTAGEATIEREWDALDFVVAAGHTLDPELAAGAFEGEFIVTFAPGKNRHAYIGAIVRSGSLIIMRDEEVLLSDYAEDEARMLMTRLPIHLPRRHERLVYRFRSDGSRPVQLRALWRPEDAEQPRALK